MVTGLNDKVVALPAGGSSVEESLGVSETVVRTGARGATGFAHTSARLLGFSSEIRRWSEIPLAAEERVEQQLVLPRLILVHGERALYGFQEGRGHRFQEALGSREVVRRLHGRGHVAVVVTSERAVAFSSYTGRFFPSPGPPMSGFFP